MEPVRRIAEKYEFLRGALDERGRRLWAAVEARELGRGGVSIVSRATGLSRTTITTGLSQLNTPVTGESPRIRKKGAGRPKLVTAMPGLAPALVKLVDTSTRGDPMAPLRWTCKSLRVLSAELAKQGFEVSPPTVGGALRQAGYSLQANRKVKEGSNHPDRNAQFEFIAAQTRSFQEQGQPVISVDTKKKECIGDFKNGGREWLPEGDPELVRVHDFEDPAQGKAIPYGIYDLARNAGWVNVGTDHDTPEFAVASIETWWNHMGRQAYPRATSLLVTADGGGSNSSRAHQWKLGLQKLVDRTGLRISIAHFPPGTSKWNKIEHRMFCHITRNWRGRPLISHEVVVKLIANTTTAQGLKVGAAIEHHDYPTGIKATKEELKTLRIWRNEFHGNWNYAIITRREAESLEAQGLFPQKPQKKK